MAGRAHVAWQGSSVPRLVDWEPFRKKSGKTYGVHSFGVHLGQVSQRPRVAKCLHETFCKRKLSQSKKVIKETCGPLLNPFSTNPCSLVLPILPPTSLHLVPSPNGRHWPGFAALGPELKPRDSSGSTSLARSPLADQRPQPRTAPATPAAPRGLGTLEILGAPEG